jgi:hypothetical protein
MRSSCSRVEECPTCKHVMPSELFANHFVILTDQSRSHDNPAPVFHPEFGRFMLEATPGKPWGIGFKDLLDVEPNMKWR